MHGSGVAGDPAVELAELLCEVVLTPARLAARGAAALRRRRADRARPRSAPIGWWLTGESVHARLRRERVAASQRT